MKKAMLVLSVIVLALFGAFSVAADGHMGTIADIVVTSTSAETPEFTVLLAAVQAADPAILEALSNPESGLTVFAPTDAAFAAAFEALGVTPDAVLADTATLNRILMYHVVPGVFNAEAVVALDGALIGTTVPETALAISVVDGSVLVNEATVVTPDVLASNGVVHVIDSVLLPPADEMAMEDGMMTEEAMADDMAMPGTIADIVIASAGADAPEFTVLLAAVQAADPSVLTTLTGGGPFTVFAPTDAAFTAALEALGLTAEELLADTALLTQVLAYHVVPGQFSAETVVAVASVEGGVRVATLLPGTAVTVVASDMGVMVDAANVVTTDVAASNGIVHVIDAVLLPPSDSM
jgi:uncharacterized surface protein with fasciclin (FAS1) repeats